MAAHHNVHADATIVVGDVGPRDGFQMKTVLVATEQTIEIVNGLIEPDYQKCRFLRWFLLAQFHSWLTPPRFSPASTVGRQYS